MNTEKEFNIEPIIDTDYLVPSTTIEQKIILDDSSRGYHTEYRTKKVNIPASHKFDTVKFKFNEKLDEVQNKNNKVKFKKVRFFKNLQFTLWPRINFFKKASSKTFMITIKLNKSMLYELPDPNDRDQNDWCKLTGLSYNEWSAQKNSIMCGFRNNTKKSTFELCPYYHDLKGRQYYPKSTNKIPIVQIPHSAFDEDLDILVDVVISGKDIDISARYQFTSWEDRVFGDISYKCAQVNPDDWAREINTWFGGNENSPKNMYLHKTKMLEI